MVQREFLASFTSFSSSSEAEISPIGTEGIRVSPDEDYR